MMDVSHRSDIAVPIRDLILVVLPYCLRRHAAELLGLRGHPQLTQVGQKPHSMGIRDLPLLTCYYGLHGLMGYQFRIDYGVLSLL